MPQEIIFTTLPFRRLEKDGQPFLKCSVHVSIKLGTPKDTTLKEFEDILNWPQKLLDSDFQFRLKNGDLVDAELDSGQIDPVLYSNIFHQDIRVDDFKEDDLSAKQINSFPIKHINDFVLKNYRLISVESPKKLVPPEFFIDEDRFGAISRIKLDARVIEQAENPQRKRAVKMNRMMVRQDDSERKLQTRIRSDKFRSFSPAMSPQDDFTELRKFHKVDRQQVVRPLLQIKKPSFEFHDILAVANNYPQILRKLGLVLDFLIPYSSSLPGTGTLQLVPNGLVFQEEGTTVSIPATAYEITSTGFYASDKPGSVFKKGFVRINTSGFTVVQVDTDGTALKTNLMTENKVQQIARFYEVRSELSVSKILVAKQLDQVEPPQDEGLPYMRSAGIAVTRNGMAEYLFSKIKNNLEIRKAFTSADVKQIQMVPRSLRTNTGEAGNVQQRPAVEATRRNAIQSNIASAAMLKIKEPVIILYSDDIVQGYRMDIAYESDPEKWYSLHQRQDQYTWYDEANNPHPIEGIGPDEGFLQLGVTEDPDDPDDVFIPETLARWEGWSLSVRKPGLAINEADDYKTEPGETGNRDFVHKSKVTEMRKYAFDPDLEFRLNALSRTVPGTLPKLRFGNDYRIRIRTVDLAGNSIPLEQQSESASDTIRTNIRYMRYEPLSSPIVLVGNELKDGEFLESMVVRSNFDMSSSQYENKYPVKGQKFDDFSQRYLLPPKNSQQIAETHGMFEKAFRSNPEAIQEIFNIITSHEELYQQDEKNREKVYKPSDVEIIYLPDPMAAGVALFLAEGTENTHTQEFKPRLFSFFSKDELTPDQTNVPIPEDWYNAGVVRIRLEEGDLKTDWDRSARIFTVFLPKGYRLKIRFSTFWREDDLKKLSAVWQMVKDEKPKNLAEIDRLACSGQHWMVSPSREIELVHAVQQPVEEPVLEKVIPSREFNQTIALINTKFKVHGESTEKVELQAKWTEPLDDGISVTIKEKQGRNSIPDIQVNYHDDVITKGTVPKPVELKQPEILNLQVKPIFQFNQRTRAQFEANPQPDAKKINQQFTLQNNSYKQFQSARSAAPKTLVNKVKFDIQETRFSFLKQMSLRILPLEQQFGDTKHRWVDYKLVAVSRYGEYFDKILKEYPDLVTFRESPWMEKINILSTARPKAPEIDYVIPTFEWRKTQTKDALRHQRLGGGLRVFLKRPWYSTGIDEMLAVILPDQAATSNLRMLAVSPQGYTPYYTHWGMDPVLYSVQPENFSPEPEDFRMNPVVDDKLQYPEQGNLKAKAVAYPVRFDEDRQMWFCDIAINPKGMYFPFIKLALARYQPYSVRKENEDMCLSPVVFSTFMQLVPDRQTTLRFNQDDVNSRFTLTVEGTIYNERLASYGNYNFLKISFIDSKIAQPIFGLIHDGVNEKKLEDEGVEIRISQADVKNNRFTISKEFRLPSAYKKAPFQVVIEEYERGPGKMKVDINQNLYGERITQSEETDRLIYADVIKINEVK